MKEKDLMAIYDNLNIAYGLLIANDEILYEDKMIIGDYIEESIHYLQNIMLGDL